MTAPARSTPGSTRTSTRCAACQSPLRARARSLSPEAQAALDQALAPHIEAVMGFAMTCAEHPAARASFQRFGELQPGQARDPRLTAPAPAQ